MGVRAAGQVAGLLGGWLPWQAQLGHRLSQGCQPAPGGGPPAQLAGWKGLHESTAAYFNRPVLENQRRCRINTLDNFEKSIW